MELTKISLDGFDYDAAPQIKKAFEKKENELSELLKEKKAIQKTLDETQARCDQLNLELEKKNQMNFDQELKKATQNRVTLLNKVSKITNLDNLEELSDLEIKKSVLLKEYENLNLDSKSEDYINARFDALCYHLEKNKEKLSECSEKIGSRSDAMPSKKAFNGLDIIKDQWKLSK